MNRDMLLRMLDLQDHMNAKVNPDWKTANYPWLRAVGIEAAEAMDHLGWKWWKAQPPNMAQFKIELVDIWHFALSDAIVLAGGSNALAASWIEERLQSRRDSVDHGVHIYTFKDMDLLSRVELLGSMAGARRFSFPLFATILDGVEMTWSDLFVGYVSKNVLNFFRQDNGYKTGTYIKQWGDVEDNVVLETIVAGLDPADNHFKQQLYHGLTLAYADVLAVNGRHDEAGVLRAAYAT